MFVVDRQFFDYSLVNNIHLSHKIGGEVMIFGSSYYLWRRFHDTVRLLWKWWLLLTVRRLLLDHTMPPHKTVDGTSYINYVIRFNLPCVRNKYNCQNVASFLCRTMYHAVAVMMWKACCRHVWHIPHKLYTYPHVIIFVCLS